MNVSQLTTAQLEELAQSYLVEHSDHEPSYGELADALQTVGLDTIMQEYADIEFTPDDFMCTAPQPERYEVREVDAIAYDDDWTYNTTYRLGTFATYSHDIPRAFRRYLKTRHGITFHRGRTVTEYDGDVYEIVDRATREPLFTAIPQEV